MNRISDFIGYTLFNYSNTNFMATKKLKSYKVYEATKYVLKSLPVNYKTKSRSMNYTILMRLVKAGWVIEKSEYTYTVKEEVQITKEMLDSLVSQMSKEVQFIEYRKSN